jgi:hypothetical protein
MTLEQKQEYHGQLKSFFDKYMLEHNLYVADRNTIMQHLQSMYRKMEDEGLVKYGLTYPMFLSFAQESYVMSELQDEFGR